jgi:hypothetical protein
MKKLGLLLSLFSIAVFGESLKGTISDSKCGTAHTDASEKSKACVEKCIKGGQKPVLVSEGKVYQLENPDKVSPFLGHKVQLSGKVTGDSIKVSKVKSAS